MSQKMQTTATKEKAQPTLVPKLRFTEFMGADDWSVSPLSQYVDSLDAGVSAVSGDRPAMGNEVGILKTSSVTNGTFNPQENKVVFDEEQLHRVRESVSADSIVISRMNTPALVGANAYVEKSLSNIFLPDRLWAAKPKPNSSMRFLAFVLGSEAGRTALSELATGTSGSMKNITKSDVLALKIAAPAFAEQQKIADCLSSLDELIAAQARKLDTLKTQKEGLMLQLFPCEGETQPHLRFPEFRDAGEWAERKAGSLFTHRTTRGEQGLPIYSVTMNDGMVRRDSLGRKVDDIEDAAGNKKVFRNDIAYNMMRMWQGAMGVAPEDCLVSPAYVVLAPKKEAMPHFFQYLFKLPAMLQLLTSHSRGLTKDRLRLYFDDFAKMEFRCPTVKEQQRIADFLASIDEHIATQTDGLETLKIHKKGLMQQLFPAAEALEA